MTDNRTERQRSFCMSQIKSRDTRPELIVRRYLHSIGLRYSLHSPKLPGKPDLTLRKYRCVVFVNGCFWHGHFSCKYAKIPKSNNEFWNDKIEKNKIRDQANIIKLQRLGWRVFTIWECELKSDEAHITLEMLGQRILSG